MRDCVAQVSSTALLQPANTKRTWVIELPGGVEYHPRAADVEQSAMPEDFSLHSQLAADTTPLGELPLSRLLLREDRRYPWLLLLPRRSGAGDITDLPAADQALLMTEIGDVAAALKAETRCDRLNVAALGNLVPQLHVHLIARFRTDDAWPRPVWGIA